MVAQDSQPAQQLSLPGLPETDAVRRPAHYNTGQIEVIEFLEDQNLEPHEWNAVKYVSRAKHKGRRIEDLEKAIWYLERKIELLKAEEEKRKPLRPNEMALGKISAVKIAESPPLPARIEVTNAVSDDPLNTFMIRGEWKPLQEADGTHLLVFLPYDSKTIWKNFSDHIGKPTIIKTRLF